MTTRWHPDTCTCVVEYDASLTATAIINKCQKHTTLATPAALLLSLLNHNRAKNNVTSWMMANKVSLGLPLNIDGTPAAVVTYNFSGASAVEPVLVIIHAFNALQIAAFQSAADTQFGVNHVTAMNVGP